MESRLRNFHPAQFMRSYWQKKPLFVQNALATDFLSLRPADLFRLAGRAEVESRLISRKNVRKRWRYAASDGPFEKTQFAALRKKANWTLLVQRVNEWLPRVDLLFEYFNFIANWRIDDIMISYATPGGTVGPHLDNYDVFLCQLQGNRRWQYDGRASGDEKLETDQPVRLLTNFKADFEVLARPGDVLYIPPRYAHYGVADEESITVSVGFRAPQVGHLMEILFDRLMSEGSAEFYTDKGAATAKNPGRFDEKALKKLHSLAKSGLARGSQKLKVEALNDALLRHLSASPHAQVRSRADLSLVQFKSRWLRQPLQRNPRNAYFFREIQNAVTLYAAGESIRLPAELRSAVADFCNARLFTATPARLQPHTLDFWYEIYSLGFVFFQK